MGAGAGVGVGVGVGSGVGVSSNVGDSLRNDVRGAKNQGIKVLWINRKGRVTSSSNIEPDFVASDLTGVLNILSDEK